MTCDKVQIQADFIIAEYDTIRREIEWRSNNVTSVENYGLTILIALYTGLFVLYYSYINDKIIRHIQESSLEVLFKITTLLSFHPRLIFTFLCGTIVSFIIMYVSKYLMKSINESREIIIRAAVYNHLIIRDQADSLFASKCDCANPKGFFRWEKMKNKNIEFKNPANQPMNNLSINTSLVELSMWVSFYIFIISLFLFLISFGMVLFACKEIILCFGLLILFLVLHFIFFACNIWKKSDTNVPPVSQNGKTTTQNGKTTTQNGKTTTQNGKTTTAKLRSLLDVFGLRQIKDKTNDINNKFQNITKLEYEHLNCSCSQATTNGNSPAPSGAGPCSNN